MQTTVIGPIISFIFLAIKVIFGIDFGDDLAGEITTWVTSGVSLAFLIYGIIKNHQTPKKEGN